MINLIIKQYISLNDIFHKISQLIKVDQIFNSLLYNHYVHHLFLQILKNYKLAIIILIYLQYLDRLFN
jgi:hypothetical protein